jgi:rare lipoprotein A
MARLACAVVLVASGCARPAQTAERIVATPIVTPVATPTSTPLQGTASSGGPGRPAPHLGTMKAPGPSGDRVSPAAKPDSTCTASWFGRGQGARPGFTAAHRTYDVGSRWTIRHAGHDVSVTVIGRGPFVAGRCWDLSPEAFEQLAPLGAGVINVTWEAA